MLPGDLSGYNQFYRLVTANFLHWDLIHIFINTYALMNLGPLVEHLAGRRRFLAIYLATGMSGFLLSALRSPLSLSVGASASIYGLLGFLVIFGWRQGGPAGRALSAHLFRWVIIGVFLSLVPGIDLYAHLGGLVAGALLGALLPWREPRSVRGDRILNLVLFLSLLVIVLSLAGVVWDWGRNQALWPNIDELFRTGSSSLPRVAPPR
jgi:rhomboid protease GluP